MKGRFRLGRLLFVVGALLSVALSAQVVFGMTDDTIRTGEKSRWVRELVHDVRPDAARSTPADKLTLPATFGGPGPAKTLVLYDGTGHHPHVGELYGIATANLATHFGTVQLHALEDYTAGQMGTFDGVVYVGTTSRTELPQAFVDDVRSGTTPVLWTGENVEHLIGPDPADHGEFVRTYGWDPRASRANSVDRIEAVVYNDRPIDRDPRSGAIIVAAIVDDDIVDVLAEAACGSGDADPVDCEGLPGQTESYFPYAVRSHNLTFVGEVPLRYLNENSPHLVLADLFYDLLAPDTAPVRQAAVRLEDVGPEADPADLRRIADYLHGQGIPFQVAVIPMHISRVPGAATDRWYGISLLDTPHVVSALKYMQERGGTLIQHGTSHQYGALDNPYTGASGGDFEFYRAKCTSTENPPHEYEPCVTKSWVQLTGPVSQDAVNDHEGRMEIGREIMLKAGLGDATVFEIPHYAASANTYEAIRTGYEARYDRGQYFSGLVSGRTFEDDPYLTQIFPYRVHDVYGSTVLPENIGNVALAEQNNHPARPPSFLIDNAEANLVVRESTASFFFHPFLETELLDEVVQGITALGYTFVPATELR